MTQDKSTEAREGLASSVKGKAKEVTGAVTGNDSLTAEGQLQQAEADARREASARDAVAQAGQEEARQRAADRLSAAREEAAAREQETHRAERDALRAHDAAHASADAAERAAERAREDARRLDDQAGLG